MRFVSIKLNNTLLLTYNKCFCFNLVNLDFLLVSCTASNVFHHVNASLSVIIAMISLKFHHCCRSEVYWIKKPRWLCVSFDQTDRFWKFNSRYLYNHALLVLFCFHTHHVKWVHHGVLHRQVQADMQHNFAQRTRL